MSFLHHPRTYIEWGEKQRLRVSSDFHTHLWCWSTDTTQHTQQINKYLKRKKKCHCGCFKGLFLPDLSGAVLIFAFIFNWFRTTLFDFMNMYFIALKVMDAFCWRGCVRSGLPRKACVSERSLVPSPPHILSLNFSHPFLPFINLYIYFKETLI